MDSANAAGVDLSQLLRLGAVPAAVIGCKTGVESVTLFVSMQEGFPKPYVALFVTMHELSWVELS